MESLKIFLLSITAAIAYGIAHDQVTTRICVEYFTLGHPPVFDTSSPTLLALGWGVIATWWVGLLLGAPLALCSRAGALPKLRAAQLVKPIAILLAVMGILSVLAGAAGFIAARSSWIILLEPIASKLPLDRHVPFIVDMCAHNAAYAVGFIGGFVICLQARRRRRHSSRQSTSAARPLASD